MSFIPKHKYTQWHGYKRVPSWALPYETKSWILDKGSLTKRLIAASNESFCVKVIYQGRAYPHLDETKNLNISQREKALVREVELVCDGVVWVRARSVIPISTMTGPERELNILGNRPLGAYLFKSKTMRRSNLELCRFNIDEGKQIYGRRSIFYLNSKPLLVSEFFMPRVFQCNKY